MYHFNDDSFLFLIYYIGSCFKGLNFHFTKLGSVLIYIQFF